MPILQQQEQKISAWMASHGQPRACPHCGSEERRIDLEPPPVDAATGLYGSGQSDLFTTRPVVRIAITCRGCAMVRWLDAQTVGI